MRKLLLGVALGLVLLSAQPDAALFVRFEVNVPDVAKPVFVQEIGRMVTLVLSDRTLGFVPTTYDGGAIRIEIYSIVREERTLLTHVDLPNKEPATADTATAFAIRLIALSETR